MSLHLLDRSPPGPYQTANRKREWPLPGVLDDEAERRRDAARLDALERRLAVARPQKGPAGPDIGQGLDQANMAWRMVVELVAGLLIGFGIGFGLDWLLGTRPILLVIFVLAGMAAGVKTMMRTARELGAPPPGDNQTHGAAVGDDDDEDEGY